MFKKYLTLSVFLILFFSISILDVSASGKMEVGLGERVTIQADEVSGGIFKWVAKKDREIVSTQNTSLFIYAFDRQGEYEINLSVTDASGKSKNTSILVLVGDRYKTPESTGISTGGSLGGSPYLNYATLPLQNAQKNIRLLGEKGRVIFDMDVSEDILEYRIDRNIFVDSDGNGIPNDDIDNANDNSYLLGGVWQTEYVASEADKITAEVTVVDKNGQKSRSQVEVFFEPATGKEGKIVAAFDHLPTMDATSKKIHLYGDRDTVAFYPRLSQGEILEYRIDRNIFVDSDGDGNPENDIDNRTDASFRSGDVWVNIYEKTTDPITAQLIVVGKGGAGSRIRRDIVFVGEKPVVESSEIPIESQPSIRLKADKEFVQKGDPIDFTVEGLSQSLESYSFDWDFNGDGTVDQTIEGNNKVSYIYDVPGIQPVKLHVRDIGGNAADFQLEVLVKDTISTKADFEFTVEKNKVTFNNLSLVGTDSEDRNLSYTWSFGDTEPENYEAQKDKISLQSPVYSYSKPGTYLVSLTVMDSTQISDTKNAEIVIEEVSDSASQEPSEKPLQETPIIDEEGGSLIWTILKIIIYILLAVLLLVLVIISGLLIFLKIQHPDLIFEELIDELKIKILGMLGMQDVMEATSNSSSDASASLAAAYEASARAKPTPKASSESSEKELKNKPEPEPESPSKEAELAKSDAPVPEWLKKATTSESPKEEKPVVIEGVVEESASVESNSEATTPVEPKNDAPVPDWLKNV